MPIAPRRWRRLLPCLLVLSTLPWAARPAAAATSRQVDDAVRRAIENLYAAQHDGNWELVAAPKMPSQWDAPDSGQWGGLTGISTFALLAAGENPLDPRLQNAVGFLERAQLRGTYAVSMRSQVWPLVPTSPAVKEAARRDVRLLLGGAKTQGDARAMWYYYVDEPKDQRGDHSATQLAVLGVWACAEAGVEVPDTFWQLEDATWRQHQSKADGSWAYVYNDKGAWGRPYLSMTVAGLATLFITQDKLADARKIGSCTGRPRDEAIEKGMKWVAKEFPEDFGRPTPNMFIPLPGRDMYLLFGLQRLGVASGQRYFGGKDWFKAGADYLVRTQKGDGGWGNTTWETAFGLLFLARGRAPVAFNKLDYDPDSKDKTQAWDERPRDVANATAWASKHMERRLNWQVVDANTDPLEWLDAPVLYVSGSDAPNLTDAQKAKLRAYVEAGGMLVGNADCSNPKFTVGFRALGQALFPKYEFRELPADHPIYTREQFPAGKWPRRPGIQAMSNGVRELMLLFPDADPARSWQTQTSATHPELFEAATDIFLYAAGLDSIREKGDGYYVAADPSAHADKTLKVARLQYPGNWDPEPGGWRRLANVILNDQHVALTVEPVELGKGKLDESYKVAHLTGTTKFALTAEARAELKAFVEKGGTLVVDSAGGGRDFAAAADAELNKTFGAAPAPLAPDHALLTAPNDLQKVRYRRAARAVVGSTSTARLTGIEVGGRMAVVNSALDLSAGLVGSGTDGITGYDPASATALMVNILSAAAK